MKVPIRIVNINFQSVKFRQCRLSSVLQSVNPDIVFGTETWLDENINDQEIFSRGYIVNRKDRAASGGGVLIAIKDGFNCKDARSQRRPGNRLRLLTYLGKGDPCIYVPITAIIYLMKKA